MKLSKRTLDILKNFSTINPSLMIKKGSTLSTIAQSKKIMATATVEEDFPHDFGIYELSKLLGIMSFFSDPEITIGEKLLTIEADGRKLDYTYTEPETILRPPEKGLVFDIDASFSLPAKSLGEALKAAGVLSLPELEFTGKDGTVSVRAVDVKNPSSHSFRIELGDTDKSFRLVYNVETFKFIPADYTAYVSFSKLARFSTDGLEYTIAASLAEEK